MFIGGLLILVYALLLRCPTLFRRALDAYPRSVWPGRVLTAVALVWFALNLWQVDFGGLSYLKNLLYVLVPLGWWLVVTYIPDLLSVRALSCVLLLAGNPLLVETRWHGSPAQWAIGILVYVVILKCMFLMVYPHFWKRGLAWAYASEGRRTLLAGLGMGLGLVFVILGGMSL